MRLSIVLPCYNEEHNIEGTIQDLRSWGAQEGVELEIVAVDDGSTDGTWGILQRLAGETSRIRLVRHERNLGYGSAVRAGCDAAMDAPITRSLPPGGERGSGEDHFIGFMDSDGQFKAEDWSKLLPFLGEYQFVTGRRLHRADPFIRKVNAKLFGILTFLVLGVWIRDINCAMKVWRRDLWPRIRPVHATGALINAEMFYRLHRLGIPWKTVPVHHYPRLKGVQTGAHLGVIFRMFRDLLALRREGFQQ
ncbi:MAG: glycosyltransferase family 2 protein [Candidatus Peribacteraceae bacterium]|nr:glycosyltransferase family 2 protein [Candidatus Peribacteraceae bacterium]MDD5739358.1 glycosyltransferase family 2 protein [Candidatus Peribacteraceae bacterium]